ncbi:MAG: hypothetical protein EHM45_02005 [Desulfobacteraceae bacterium]|nr:MAG: hypothetical protein EHM45_02005 [Desulfobacteraceae bacterium]
MKRTIRPFLIMVVILLASPILAVEPIKPKYQIEVKIYKAHIPISQSDLKNTATKIPQMDYLAGGDWVLNFDNLRVEIKGDKILWNGKPNPPEALSGSVFSIPPVIALPAQDITIEAISSPVQYFIKRADGVYLLQEAPQEKRPGVKLFVKLELSDELKKIRLHLKLRYCRLIARTPLEGVSLDVGLPKFQMYESEDAAYKVPIGQWVVFQPAIHGLVFALMVKRTG